MRSATAQRRGSLKVAHDVLRAWSLAKLQESSETINALPSALRTEPLRNAMLLIQALPEQDKAQAVTELKAAVHQQAAQDHPSELPRLEKMLGRLDAETAVSYGFNVAVVARAFGHDWRVRVEELENFAICCLAPNTAGAAIEAGENVRAVAERFGITTPQGILALEDRTIRSYAPNTAGSAIRAGESVLAVADRFGITSQEGIGLLKNLAMNLGTPVATRTQFFARAPSSSH